jgi:hypothetical protein
MRVDTKQAKLAVRNFFNKVTGQQALIDEYYNIIHKIAQASDHETDPVKKQQMIEERQNLSEEKWIPLGNTGLEIKDFNAYKPFQTGVLSAKIKTGNQLLLKFDLV